MVMGKILSGYGSNRMGTLDPEATKTNLSILDSIVGAISSIGDTAMKVATPIITSKNNLQIAKLQSDMSAVNGQLQTATDQYTIDQLNIKKSGLAEAAATLGLAQTATGSSGGFQLTPLGMVVAGTAVFLIAKNMNGKKK